VFGMSDRSSIRRGVALAALAAVLFGVTAPFLKVASAGVGPFATSATLYLGAALSAALVILARRGRAGHALLTRRAVPRVLLVAALGAACGPALLVSGLKRADAATASLLLVMEAPFTLLLARTFLRELTPARVVIAALLILAGAVLLLGRPAGATTWLGGALVAAAALAWALDNLFSRALADSDPSQVVALKGALGGLLAAAAAIPAGEPLPSFDVGLALFGLGAIGYGLSLQLYLRAQHLMGAGRTASVFATAPFVGAGAALLIGGAWPTWQLLAAAALMGLGVWLHATERHRHRHHHEAVQHDHWHRHDDGHHDHAHDPPVVGPHSHTHTHEATDHEHEHADDLHHRHSHGPR
jgi:drug/metabolite transporter (DMT)-like permease